MAQYKLDTGNSGNDEILVGDSVAEVTQDVLNRYEVDELPANWTIDLIDDPAEVDCSTAAITRQALDAGKIVHTGWTLNGRDALLMDSRPEVTCDVSVTDYFDAKGKFLGVDENGLVPTFEAA